MPLSRVNTFQYSNKGLGEKHAKPLPGTLVVSVEIEIVSTDKMHLVVRENLQDLYDSPYTVRHLSRLRNPALIDCRISRATSSAVWSRDFTPPLHHFASTRFLSYPLLLFDFFLPALGRLFWCDSMDMHHKQIEFIHGFRQSTLIPPRCWNVAPLL